MVTMTVQKQSTVLWRNMPLPNTAETPHFGASAGDSRPALMRQTKGNIMRKHPRFGNLSLKDLPETTREQLTYLVDERGHTITGAVTLGIRLVYQEEYATHVEESQESPSE